MALTHLEARVIAKLLNLASDEFSKNCCNDLKLADLGLNPDEVKELQVALNAAYFDASNPTDRVCTEGVTYDWVVFQHMANRIGAEHRLEVPK
jgi:hypothetical protein